MSDWTRIANGDIVFLGPFADEEHTREVLCDLLGMSEDEVRTLAETGITALP